jgi:FkbM family methyltransferase
MLVERKRYLMIHLIGLLSMSVCSLFADHGGKTYSHTDFQGVPLDHKLLEIMNFRNGVFIEVGALDGLIQSNTKLLEECYGWTGILVEPSPSVFERLAVNRPHSKCFQCALGSFEENGTYAYGDFNGHPMSSLVGRTENPANVRVQLRSLQSILDECDIQHINFFSLDTEGYELQILKGIDFNTTTFDYMLIEVYVHQYDEIVQFLSERGYDPVCCFTNYNKTSNPHWDGTHNDYLFKKREL